MSWTEDRVATLTQMWLAGFSASQIAGRIGGVSRNAVIGKVTRLGIADRGRPAEPRAPAPAKRVADRACRPSPQGAAKRLEDARLRVASISEALVGPAVVVVEKSRRHGVTMAAEALKGTATLFDLGAHMCKWPIGEPTAEGFSFCGRPAGEKAVYCSEHARVAYKPTPPRDKTVRKGRKLPLWARS